MSLLFWAVVQAHAGRAAFFERTYPDPAARALEAVARVEAGAAVEKGDWSRMDWYERRAVEFATGDA